MVLVAVDQARAHDQDHGGTGLRRVGQRQRALQLQTLGNERHVLLRCHCCYLLVGGEHEDPLDDVLGARLGLVHADRPSELTEHAAGDDERDEPVRGAPQAGVHEVERRAVLLRDALEDLREQLAVAVEPAAARGRAGGVDGLLGGVLEHQAVHLGVLDAPVEIGGDPAAQRRGGRAAFLGGVLGVGEGLEGAVDRRLEELVLVLVVEVDRGARVAETARDLEQGELLGALLLDDLGGHAKDVVRELRVGRSCCHGVPP